MDLQRYNYSRRYAVQKYPKDKNLKQKIILGIGVAVLLYVLLFTS